MRPFCLPIFSGRPTSRLSGQEPQIASSDNITTPGPIMSPRALLKTTDHRSPHLSALSLGVWWTWRCFGRGGGGVVSELKGRGFSSNRQSMEGRKDTGHAFDQQSFQVAGAIGSPSIVGDLVCGPLCLCVRCVCVCVRTGARGRRCVCVSGFSRSLLLFSQHPPR